MPPPTTSRAMAPATSATIRKPRPDTTRTEGSGDIGFSDGNGRRGSALVIAVRNAEDDRNEKQRGHGCESQAANDRATQRRVLFAALAQTQRHRRHADDHGKRGHQHGTETYKTGLERSGDRIAELLQAL